MIKDIVKQRIENTFSKLESNPQLMDIPRDNLKRFVQNNHIHSKYINQWENILTLPIVDIKKLMLADNEYGEILRSTSIFIRIP